MENFVYFDAMKKDQVKAKLLDYGIKQRLVQQFDDWLIIKLRHIYYGGIPGSLYMYMRPLL